VNTLSVAVNRCARAKVEAGWLLLSLRFSAVDEIEVLNMGAGYNGGRGCSARYKYM
jgi:hypothetical protein